MAQVAGAVIAPGTLVVESSPKQVQHSVGGIVSEILADDDDRVQVGQVLLRLDGTVDRAEHEALSAQLDEALLIEARLAAETAGDEVLTVPAVLGDRVGDRAIATLLQTQEQLMRARKDVRLTKVAQLKQQIVQLENSIAAQRSQKSSNASQLAVTEQELSGLSSLLEKSLVSNGRVNDLHREVSRLAGLVEEADFSIARDEALVLEKQVLIDQVEKLFLSQALEELQSVREKITGLMQQRVVVDARLQRLDIRAPQAGVIHESVVHTVSGVVEPGQVLMLVVPTADELVVDLKLNLLDVDKVNVGQPMFVRVLGMDPRTAPDLRAQVMQVAPDLTTDPVTRTSYYLVRARISSSDVARLGEDRRLIAGMSVEGFIQTGERSVLTYLLEPLLNQLRHALRET